MNEYQPNSHKYKEEQEKKPERKITKVTDGPARVRKKTGVNKFVDTFISEDVENVKSYIVTDVLIPAIKNTILDIITDSANMFFGGSGRSKRGSSGSKISYRNFYEQRDTRGRVSESKTSTRFDYNDIVFDSRGEAQAALDQMEDVISEYGFVTVADFYDMADLSQPYTSNKYGWTNVRNAEVLRLRDGGYIIKLPKAMPIE